MLYDTALSPHASSGAILHSIQIPVWPGLSCEKCVHSADDEHSAKQAESDMDPQFPASPFEHCARLD